MTWFLTWQQTLALLLLAALVASVIFSIVSTVRQRRRQTVWIVDTAPLRLGTHADGEPAYFPLDQQQNGR